MVTPSLPEWDWERSRQSCAGLATSELDEIYGTFDRSSSSSATVGDVGDAPVISVNEYPEHKCKCTCCERIHGTEIKLLKCSGCRIADYCNYECQRRHWQIHTETCRVHLNKRDQDPKYQGCTGAIGLGHGRHSSSGTIGSTKFTDPLEMP